ncbi:MAG: polysaccharide deacetylase family protein [Firmicutes bacterium]|nr:polysaccharide deacetylase family protein [Bacillota bacterium]
MAVLLFHAIDPDPTKSYALTPAELEETFWRLKTEGYSPISLKHFHEFLQGRRKVPQKAVLITFDDGYEDLADFALPLTQKFRFPAVVFAVAKWFEPHPRPEPHRPHLSTEQARRLLETGYWSLAGHSYDGHGVVPVEGGGVAPFYLARRWLCQEGRRETEEERRGRVWQDILLTAQTLKKVGVREVMDFAYPFGAGDETTRSLLQEAGFAYHYTTEPGLNHAGQDLTRIKRITAREKAAETMRVLERLFAEDRSN